MSIMQDLFSLIPVKTICILFVCWSNSSYNAQISKHAGFYCDDESIKKSYHGDSINIYYLLFTLLGPLAYIVHKCECTLEDKKKVPDKKSSNHIHLKDYYSGILYVITVTEAIKCFFCQLRPHFFYTCLPDMSKIDCSKGFVTDFECTGSGPKWLLERDIYKSFPSGHSSSSVFSFIFISLLLYLKIKNSEKSSNTWWLKFVPVLFFFWALLCCLSRYFDNRHFLRDIIVGGFIGVIVGINMARVSMQKYSRCKAS